jgi:hypothetical protein
VVTGGLSAGNAGGASYFGGAVTAAGRLNIAGGPDGAVAAGNAQFAAQATNGAVISGQGSVYDSSILNKNASVAIGIPTGTVNAVFNGAATFAGAVTTANKFAVSAYASNSFLTGNGSGFLDNYYNGGSGFDTMSFGVNYDRRNNAISATNVATGDLRFEQGTGGQSNFVIAIGTTNTVPTDRFTIASSGTATFTGAVVAASLATAQTAAAATSIIITHKIPITLNGIVYYMALTATP